MQPLLADFVSVDGSGVVSFDPLVSAGPVIDALVQVVLVGLTLFVLSYGVQVVMRALRSSGGNVIDPSDQEELDALYDAHMAELRIEEGQAPTETEGGLMVLSDGSRVNLYAGEDADQVLGEMQQFKDSGKLDQFLAIRAEMDADEEQFRADAVIAADFRAERAQMSADQQANIVAQDAFCEANPVRSMEETLEADANDREAASMMKEHWKEPAPAPRPMSTWEPADGPGDLPF